MTAGLAALAAAGPAQAATYNVTGFGDTAGDCGGTGPYNCTTLRAAITAANRSGIANTVVMPKGDYNVTQGQLPLASDLTVIGDSAATTTLSGDGKSFRLFNVSSASKVLIRHLTMGSSVAQSTDGGVGGVIQVGTGSDLTLDHVRVMNGKAPLGGGIGMQPASSLTISRSLIDHNQALSATGLPSSNIGGAFFSLGDSKQAGNVLHISDSTIALNGAQQGAGVVLRSNPANTTT